MTKPKNLKVNPFGEFISKLSQLPGVIDTVKKEQHLKNLESKQLHDEQAEILADRLLDRKVSEHLKSIGLSKLSENDRFDCSLKEMAFRTSKDDDYKKEITEILAKEIPFLKIALISMRLVSRDSSILISVDLSPLIVSTKGAFGYFESKFNSDFELKIVFKLLDLLFDEDVKSVLENQAIRKLKNIKSPLMKRVVLFNLFCDSLWGTKIVPYFQNKFLPNKKETDRS
jgi:hypothetical protein